jgi:hypothetical protein
MIRHNHRYRGDKASLLFLTFKQRTQQNLRKNGLSQGVILGLDFAAGSCEMYEFFEYFHEMHELSVILRI